MKNTNYGTYCSANCNSSCSSACARSAVDCTEKTTNECTQTTTRRVPSMKAKQRSFLASLAPTHRSPNLKSNDGELRTDRTTKQQTRTKKEQRKPVQCCSLHSSVLCSVCSSSTFTSNSAVTACSSVCIVFEKNQHQRVWRGCVRASV